MFLTKEEMQALTGRTRRDAQVVSDAGDADRARALLLHTDVRTTEIYLRKPETIKPLSRKRGQ